MTRKLSDRDHALDLLKTAIAALGEEIVEKGAETLPPSAQGALRRIAELDGLARHCWILTEACAILLQRSHLLG